MTDARTTWIQIVVAAVGVVGSIAVAIITSGRTFDQRFSDVQTAQQGLNDELAEAKIDVEKLQRTLDAPCLKTVVHQVRGEGLLTLSPSPGRGELWKDYPGLLVPFTLDRARTVAIFFQVTDVVLADGGYLLARLNLDNVYDKSTPAISPQTERYRTVQSLWVGTLGPGMHTAKVEYRSRVSGRNDPYAPGGIEGRVLSVVELGCPAAQ